MKFIQAIKFRPNWHYIILSLFIFIVTANISPHFNPIPRRDSGVYLYIGEHILKGDLPYRDLWDHKGPLIYYINALGVWLKEDSLWGIWIIQFISISGAVFLGYSVLSQVYNRTSALFGSLFWVVYLSDLLGGGNHVEEYALLFEFLCVMLFWKAQKIHRHDWNEFFIGIATAFSFLLRPNNVVMGLTIGGFLALEGFLLGNWRRTFRRLFAMAAGTMLVVASTLLFFASQHALPELIDSVIMYNARYASTPPFDRWQVFLEGISYLPNFSMIAIATWFSGLLYLRYPSNLSKEQGSFLALSLLSLPLAILLSLLSGRNYSHYFLIWLPSLGLLSGFFAFKIQNGINALNSFPKSNNKVNIGTVWIYALIFAGVLHPLSILLPHAGSMMVDTIQLRGLPPVDFSQQKEGAYIDYIFRHTQEDDYVLIWGNELTYNFLTGREAPSKFIYQYPFFTPNYATEKMIDEFLTDMMDKKPLIIDSAVSNPTLPSLASNHWDNFPKMQPVIRYIRDNYEITELIGPKNWPVWVYKGNN